MPILGPWNIIAHIRTIIALVRSTRRDSLYVYISLVLCLRFCLLAPPRRLILACECITRTYRDTFFAPRHHQYPLLGNTHTHTHIYVGPIGQDRIGLSFMDATTSPSPSHCFALSWCALCVPRPAYKNKNPNNLHVEAESTTHRQSTYRGMAKVPSRKKLLLMCLKL